MKLLRGLIQNKKSISYCMPSLIKALNKLRELIEKLNLASTTIESNELESKILTMTYFFNLHSRLETVCCVFIQLKLNYRSIVPISYWYSNLLPITLRATFMEFKYIEVVTILCAIIGLWEYYITSFVPTTIEPFNYRRHIDCIMLLWVAGVCT